MNFTTDIVIGLEIHVGIKTNTKLFCGCPNEDAETPNTHVCPICLGHPGSKPVVNKAVLDAALKTCLAAKCDIAPEVVFSRKSYFYPDLAKNFQTTQYELPIGSNGDITLSSGKKVGLIRIHIEEDPAALVHIGGVAGSSYSFIDYNRSGTPLLEIVTKPELSSAAEAREFLKTLLGILNYLGIFDVKNGLMKADANVSIKEGNYTRAEIKNINGFKDIERAILSEIQRQKEVVASGKKLSVETRGWDADSGTTYLLRRKETEDDYGYIIDTDLVPITITKEYCSAITLPQLPVEFAQEVSEKYGVAFQDVFIIANQKAFGDAFKKAIALVDPVLATNWFRHVIPTPFVAKYGDLVFVEKIPEAQILSVLQLFANKKISDKVAKELLEKLVVAEFDPEAYIVEHKLEMVSDNSQLEEWAKEAIAANASAVDDYKKGEEKSLNFLVGQVMKKSKGTASPADVKALIQKVLQ